MPACAYACRMDDALRVIADPVRREILALVRDGEVSAGEIAGRFAVTRPAVSHHLSVLKGAGLVVERRAGTRRYYRADAERIAELRSQLERFWDTQLARLEQDVRARAPKRP
jgi:DNA-binding transcriptional ArsR family regulator